MPREPKVKQLWRCKFCGREYASPIEIISINCPIVHTKGRSRGLFPMELVQGEMPRRRKVSGKNQ